MASSVTMVTSPLVHSRLLCGRGLEGKEEEELTWELYKSNVLVKSTFLSKLQAAALTLTVVSLTEQSHVHSESCNRREPPTVCQFRRSATVPSLGPVSAWPVTAHARTPVSGVTPQAAVETMNGRTEAAEKTHPE